MGLVQEEEEKRYFIQLALQGGKKWWSPVTSYIHKGEVIPLYENFCYVLALVSSKQKENAEKAQELLHRLLQFQIKHSSHCKGAFPLELHQYPYAKDLNFQHRLFYLMQELIHYHSLALGRVLISQLRKTASKLKRYLESQPYHSEDSLEDTVSSTKLAQHFISLRLKQDGSLQQALKQYALYWSPSLGCYVGPALDEYYVQGDLKRSIFDQFMASYYHVYPRYLKESSLLQLQGALIPYFPEKGEFSYGKQQGIFKEMPFSIWNTERDSLFLFHQFSAQSGEKGLHVLRYLWKSGDLLHHLISPSIHMHVQARHQERQTTMVFTYPQEKNIDNQDAVELEFFVNYHPEITWSVGSKKATVFYMNDRIVLHTPQQILELIFSVEEGEGDLMGHISRGNRPSQIDPKALKEYEAFDWRLSIRTLRRDSTFKLKLQMMHTQQLSCAQTQDCLEKLPSHADHCLHTESLL
jgi:hypothetical protein